MIYFSTELFVLWYCNNNSEFPVKNQQYTAERSLRVRDCSCVLFVLGIKKVLNSFYNISNKTRI